MINSITTIEERVRNRTYLTPSRARAAVSRSNLKPSQKARLTSLVEVWENESNGHPIVGGLPATEVEAHVAELVMPGNGAAHAGPTRIPSSEPTYGQGAPSNQPGLLVNLNVPVRVQLTAYGITLLYANRAHVAPFPEDIVAERGVWQTELWQFMVAMAGMTTGDVPTVGAKIEVLRLEP